MRKCSYKPCGTRAKEGITKGPQFWCSDDCMVLWAIEAGRKLRSKKEKQDRRDAKAKLKTRSEWLRDAQIAFNAWVRARDAKLPCVSCGRFHDGQWHAGHYRSVGSCPALRFEPDNTWKQCRPCNEFLSGNLINYRQELLRRIGQERLDWLEGPHEPKKYTIDQLKAIITDYRQRMAAIK